ncbi:MAG: peptide-methionine (R)-S-oxide reductase MsrB, partial [Verrucomicrobiota bacterium]
GIAMKKTILTLCLLTGILAAGLNGLIADNKKPVMNVSDKTPEQPTGTVVKTDEEWKKLLTPDQYRILRKAGTERANGQVYKEFKEQGEGTYYCAGCNAELFTSGEKFDSRCGWPSFYDPSKAKNVNYKTDYHLGYARTEVVCKVCDGHLGHVFKGEGFSTPTDKRYCINGTVLKFVPKAAVEAAKAEQKNKSAAEAAEAAARADALKKASAAQSTEKK